MPTAAHAHVLSAHEYKCMAMYRSSTAMDTDARCTQGMYSIVYRPPVLDGNHLYTITCGHIYTTRGEGGREGERERERVIERESVCVCVSLRERESERDACEMSSPPFNLTS